MIIMPHSQPARRCGSQAKQTFGTHRFTTHRRCLDWPMGILMSKGLVIR